MSTPTSIAAYLALFTLVGFLFLFVTLVVGHFLRPKEPNSEKLEVYECGEPTIGSSFVQFDLRFYVVALLFIIFDVEVAFFFPWATVFGKATHLMDPDFAKVTADGGQLSPPATALLEELGVAQPTVPRVLGAPDQAPDNVGQGIEDLARTMAQISMIDIAAFFAVLLVGFAYVWKRGDLDWVRALSRERAMQQQRPDLVREEEPALTS